MTYLTPDDWYANHGLAPGDAKGPQQPMQYGPWMNPPVPPMRGYFGSRPPKPSLAPASGLTVSPFAVSDSMWGNSPPPPGVNGLGHLLPAYFPPFASRAMKAKLAGLGCICGPPRQLGGPLGDGSADATATIAAAEKKMKAEIMEVAATNLAIGIGLSCIPVVGWAVGLVYSLVTTITEEKYQRAAQKVMADLQTSLQTFAGNLDLQMAALQAQVFDANKAAGIALATSTTPLPSTINAGTCVY